MKFTGLTALSLVSLMVVGVLAGDFAEDMRREFSMGVFPRQISTNLQTFKSAVGGVAAPPITKSTDETRPFEVGGDTFPDFATAAGRACDNQHNACAEAANSQQGTNVTVSECDTQNTECHNDIASVTTTSFATLTTSNAEFDFFCE